MEGDIAPGMRRRVGGVGPIGGHMEVAFGWVQKRRGGLALRRRRGNSRHERARVRRSAG